MGTSIALMACSIIAILSGGAFARMLFIRLLATRYTSAFGLAEAAPAFFAASWACFMASAWARIWSGVIGIVGPFDLPWSPSRLFNCSTTSSARLWFSVNTRTKPSSPLVDCSSQSTW